MTHDYDRKNFIPAPKVRRDFIGDSSAMTELTWQCKECKERARLEVLMEQARMARTEDSTNDE